MRPAFHRFSPCEPPACHEPCERLSSSLTSALHNNAALHQAQGHTHLLPLFLLLVGSCIFAAPAYSQIAQEETLGGPDSHETGQGPHGHLFGQWDGERSRLEERGVRFDFQYVSDSLWNIKSEQKERFASWR